VLKSLSAQAPITRHQKRRHDEARTYTRHDRAAFQRRVESFQTFGLRAGVESPVSLTFEGLRDTTGGLFISLTVNERQIMDFWQQTEVRIRREDALETARRSRLLRLAESGRSPSVRGRIANGAQAMSDALASLARTLRDREPA
jgi:hypothetical protein